MLKAILVHEIGYTENAACRLMRALAALRHPLTYQMGEFFCNQNYSYFALYEIIEVLIKLPRTEALENFLIEKMIELEDEHPDIKRLILDFL